MMMMMMMKMLYWQNRSCKALTETCLLFPDTSGDSGWAAVKAPDLRMLLTAMAVHPMAPMVDLMDRQTQAMCQEDADRRVELFA